MKISNNSYIIIQTADYVSFFLHSYHMYAYKIALE